MGGSTFSQFRTANERLLGQLFRKADAARWELSQETFAKALHRSATHRFGEGDATAGEIAGYLQSLHLEDLALACACIEGKEGAWEHFIATYRRDLRQAGRAIAGESLGSELADSIYADLFGLEERNGARRSLFLYFHGRSKLATWLRALLARRHVDRVREQRRLAPLEETPGADSYADPKASIHPDPHRARYLGLFRREVRAAIENLEPRQRLRLAWYYAEQLTLAQIGRLLGEHEATASRKLDRARRDLRASVEGRLRSEHHLTDAEVELCYEYASNEAAFDLGDALVAPVGKDAAKETPAAPARTGGVNRSAGEAGP
jgi:RNA polymerase sigma-70 factor (ECF subfamily)